MNWSVIGLHSQPDNAPAVDAASGLIVAQTLTDQDVDDPSQVGLLLDQIDAPIGQVTADGAYDGDPTAFDGCPQQRAGSTDTA